MRFVLSILLSISMLAGSVGVNLLNSSCDCCGGEMACECSSGCDIVAVEKTEPAHSCCSSDENEKNQDKKSSCSSDCCSPEYYKLNVPLVLSFITIKVEIPEIDLPFNYVISNSNIISWKEASVTFKVPDKPPTITRSGLDLYSTFLC